MPDSRGYRLPQWSWAAGAALALAALAALGHWFIRLSREQSWAAIETAAESKQWTEVEKGLRRWLGERPDDDKAWMMLGSLLFDQGRGEEALPALRRVRETEEGWAHARRAGEGR